MLELFADNFFTMGSVADVKMQRQLKYGCLLFLVRRQKGLRCFSKNFDSENIEFDGSNRMIDILRLPENDNV